MPDDDSGFEAIDPYNEQNRDLWFKIEHLGRYLFAADYLAPYDVKIAADISCGKGYGLPTLAAAAEQVIGVDNSTEMLRLAREHRSDDGRIRLVEADIDGGELDDQLEPRSLDAIVSFETLEHLLNPDQAIAQFAALLADGGHLICSVPNSIHDPADSLRLPRNKNHRQFFSFSSLTRLLNRHHFRVRYRLGQPLPNVLFNRERDLWQSGKIEQRLSDHKFVHSRPFMQYLAYLLAYPAAENVDRSYSLIAVAEKQGPSSVGNG